MPCANAMRALDPVVAGQAPVAQDRFAAYVAHELRTPIALQRALAEAALGDPRPDMRAMCEEIIAACDQQQRLIDALLHLTLDHPRLTCRESVDLAAMARRVLGAHEPCRLDRVVALGPAVASGDPTLLERLCANLISNAIRHNIPRGRIEVTTRMDTEHALLCVANTGPVIPCGELPRLFQPFERLGSSRRGCADGLGLGLSIVQSIADAHEAIVVARARAGGGLAIEVRLPANRSGRSGGAAALTARDSGAGIRKSSQSDHGSTDPTSSSPPRAHGSSATRRRTVSWSAASTTWSVRSPSPSGPPSRMNPSSTRPSMNAACAAHSRCLRMGRAGFQFGPCTRMSAKFATADMLSWRAHDPWTAAPL